MAIAALVTLSASFTAAAAESRTTDLAELGKQLADIADTTGLAAVTAAQIALFTAQKTEGRPSSLATAFATLATALDGQGTISSSAQAARFAAAGVEGRPSVIASEAAIFCTYLNTVMPI